MLTEKNYKKNCKNTQKTKPQQKPTDKRKKRKKNGHKENIELTNKQTYTMVSHTMPFIQGHLD